MVHFVELVSAIEHLRWLLLEQLPRRPYCCDEFVQNAPRGLEGALTKRYIQFNPPGFFSFLVVDIDRCGAADAWTDANLPPPTWIAINPRNGHAHLVWALSVPVWAGSDNQKPARFFKAVEYAYRMKLGGDEGFTRLLTKNPLHGDWHVEMPALTSSGEPITYDLQYLSEFVELPKRIPKKRAAETGETLGRNCLVFEELRFWAYLAVRRYQDPVSFGVAALDHAEHLNAALLDPLPENEICHTAKSVSKWTWSHFCGKKRSTLSVKFSEKQSARGKISGKARREKSGRLDRAMANAAQSFRRRP